MLINQKEFLDALHRGFLKNSLSLSTKTYTYDSPHRVTKMERSDGSVTIYHMVNLDYKIQKMIYKDLLKLIKFIYGDICLAYQLSQQSWTEFFMLGDG